MIVPIAQLFNITTDELLGNAKDDILISEELNEIKYENCELISKYESYRKLLKQSPINIKILKTCMNCAWSLVNRKNKYSLDAEKINELLADMEQYRKTFKNSETAQYNEWATGRLAEAYIFAEKFDKAKEIINDSTPYQFYNQDRLNGLLYFRMPDYKKSRENYAISLSSSFNWMLRDVINIGYTYADFFGQNYDKYDVDKCIKVNKTVYELIKVLCDNKFPYPYQYSYTNSCEFLAQGYTDKGDYDMALNYLSEFVSVMDEWNKLSGKIVNVEDFCFMLSDHPKQLIKQVPPIQKDYIKTVFNRNKYKHFADNPIFISLKERAEKLLQ